VSHWRQPASGEEPRTSRREKIWLVSFLAKALVGALGLYFIAYILHVRCGL